MKKISLKKILRIISVSIIPENILNKTIPKPKNTYKRKPTAPWWTEECTLAIKKRKFKKNNETSSKKRCRIHFKASQKERLAMFLLRDNDKTNSRDLWNFIRKI